jgi:hypothetical protein
MHVLYCVDETCHSWLAGPQRRRQRRQQLAAASGDPHAGSAKRKSHRAAIFAEWLIAKFGKDFLNNGSGEEACPVTKMNQVTRRKK